jgi:hypothetical protein
MIRYTELETRSIEKLRVLLIEGDDRETIQIAAYNPESTCLWKVQPTAGDCGWDWHIYLGTDPVINALLQSVPNKKLSLI